ncbi:MAG: L-threonylcarbamoyladenylate synthase [Desulfovibrionaceae bacterium]|nr:L-threonylcarbamoyladenylate synthase [Desulfovibrionaceae bacterium]
MISSKKHLLSFVTPERAAEMMSDGFPVIFPTETFFGLGSRALDVNATAAVFRAKHRSTVKPLPLILGNWEHLDLVAKISSEIMPFLEKFWPGPLSVIFPARLRVPDILTGGTGRVAVRLSSHPVARQLASLIGEPITASSANISGRPAVTRAEDLDSELCAAVRGIVDVPPSPSGGAPSTLIEYEGDMRFTLLRKGAVAVADLEQAGCEILFPAS